MKKKKIQWHPAFVAAMRLEFAGDREQLDFKSEFCRPKFGMHPFIIKCK